MDDECWRNTKFLLKRLNCMEMESADWLVISNVCSTTYKREQSGYSMTYCLYNIRVNIIYQSYPVFSVEKIPIWFAPWIVGNFLKDTLFNSRWQTAMTRAKWIEFSLFVCLFLFGVSLCLSLTTSPAWFMDTMFDLEMDVEARTRGFHMALRIRPEPAVYTHQLLCLRRMLPSRPVRHEMSEWAWNAKKNDDDAVTRSSCCDTLESNQFHKPWHSLLETLLSFATIKVAKKGKKKDLFEVQNLLYLNGCLLAGTLFEPYFA